MGNGAKYPIPQTSLSSSVNEDENSLCLIRWLRGCHELVMAKALSPGHATEQVSMKERGLAGP